MKKLVLTIVVISMMINMVGCMSLVTKHEITLSPIKMSIDVNLKVTGLKEAVQNQNVKNKAIPPPDGKDVKPLVAMLTD